MDTHNTCKACHSLKENDRDITTAEATQALTEGNLCGDCEAFFGIAQVKDLRQLGRMKAEQTLRDSANNAEGNTCETCDAVGTMYDVAGYDECLTCIIENAQYWEMRGGLTAEIVFEEWLTMPSTKSAEYQIAMASYWATLATGEK